MNTSRSLALCVLLVIFLIFPGTLKAQDKKIVGDGYFGCKSREFSDKLDAYVAQGDREAFAKALSLGYATGECTKFKQGEDVLVMDTAVFSGMVKVRRKGKTVEYWTNMEAIK